MNIPSKRFNPDTCKTPNKEQISLEEAWAQIADRFNELSPFFDEDQESEQGLLSERLTDIMDDEAALAEMQDLGLLQGLFFNFDENLVDAILYMTFVSVKLRRYSPVVFLF